MPSFPMFIMQLLIATQLLSRKDNHFVQACLKEFSPKIEHRQRKFVNLTLLTARWVGFVFKTPHVALDLVAHAL